jgi:hypothetical protein
MASLTTLGGTLIHLILAVLVFLATCFLTVRRGQKRTAHQPHRGATPRPPLPPDATSQGE